MTRGKRDAALGTGGPWGGPETLTERVARAVHVTRWCGRESTSSRDIAQAALAVVADDVDGIAGVLRAHWPNPHDGLCSCGAELAEFDEDVWPDPDAWRAHQAAMVAAHLRGES